MTSFTMKECDNFVECHLAKLIYLPQNSGFSMFPDKVSYKRHSYLRGRGLKGYHGHVVAYTHLFPVTQLNVNLSIAVKGFCRYN